MGPRQAPGGSPTRAQESPKTQEVVPGCLGGVQGLPLGDFGRRGWAWGLTWDVEVLIFHLVLIVFSRLFLFYSFFLYGFCFLTIATQH